LAHIHCGKEEFRRGWAEEAHHCEFTQEMVKYIFEKIAEHGIEVVYKLVSTDFERRLRGGRRLICVNR